MSRTLRGWRALTLVAVLFAGTTAHVGSPTAIFDGRAGTYAVRVIVRPPEVIPGTAEISVRILEGGASVQRVAVRPVFWRTGRAGSPAADDAVRVPGPGDLFAGKLWLMAAGSYNIEVEVSGAQGTGTVSVPVVGAPTAEVKLGTALTVTLLVLGAVLVAGLLSIVHAAAGEALSRPGTELSLPGRRRARIAAALAVPVVLALTVGAMVSAGAALSTVKATPAAASEAAMAEPTPPLPETSALREQILSQTLSPLPTADTPAPSSSPRCCGRAGSCTRATRPVRPSGASRPAWRWP